MLNAQSQTPDAVLAELKALREEVESLRAFAQRLSVISKEAIYSTLECVFALRAEVLPDARPVSCPRCGQRFEFRLLEDDTTTVVCGCRPTAFSPEKAEEASQHNASAAAELKVLREEIAAMRSSLLRMEYDGMPVRADADAPLMADCTACAGPIEVNLLSEREPRFVCGARIKEAGCVLGKANKPSFNDVMRSYGLNPDDFTPGPCGQGYEIKRSATSSAPVDTGTPHTPPAEALADNESPRPLTGGVAP